jgi:putative tricarboxylic transport membrane protein
LRQALIISQGEWSAFVTRPISASLLFIALLLLIGKPVFKRIKAMR